MIFDFASLAGKLTIIVAAIMVAVAAGEIAFVVYQWITRRSGE